jgi:uncharacterized protein
MIFVDTGGWFASIINDDSDHRSASSWFQQNKEPLFTTNYIVDETLTLLQAKGEYKKAIELGKLFFSDSLAFVYNLNEDDVYQSWKVFEHFVDKNWSFTDCTSKFVIEKFQITQAVAFDKHFRQFGSVVVLPLASD